MIEACWEDYRATLICCPCVVGFLAPETLEAAGGITQVGAACWWWSRSSWLATGNRDRPVALLTTVIIALIPDLSDPVPDQDS